MNNFDDLTTPPDVDAVVAEFMPYLRTVARNRRAREENRLLWITADEWEPWPPELEEDGEENYRRGYWHGYSQALDDALIANPPARRSAWWLRLAEFFDGPLMTWRYGRGGFKLPPAYGRTTRKDTA